MSITSLDPLNIVPKYYQLANMLRHKIEDGEWAPHEVIPSERQLEELYGLSRTTIRQAIAILTRQGYLYHEQGRGTFVAPQKLQKGLLELTSFSEDMQKRGLAPGQVILEMGIIEPPPKILQKLKLPDDTPKIFRLERIRLGDGQIMGLQTSYLALPEGATITRSELEKVGSLYAVLQDKFFIIPTEADETLEVTVASHREAELLQVSEGSPLLLSERVMYSQNRKAVEVVKILYRGDRYRYYVRLTRNY
jgi:GntR family transcriptional regulator